MAKIGIIGAGYMAVEHAKAFAAVDGAKIVGVHSRSFERANQFKKMFGVPMFSSIFELYNRTGADVVVVAVNELSMPLIATECFKYPWICLLEKPVGIVPELTKALVVEADIKSARVYVGLNRRSYSSTRNMIANIAIDDSPRIVNVLDEQSTEVARSAGQPEEVVKNWMYANSIHLIDYFTFLCRGKVTAVNVVRRWNPGAPRLVVANIEYSSGDFGSYQAIWNCPGPWAISATNSKVRCEVRPLEVLYVQRLGDRKRYEIPTEKIDLEFKPGLFHQAMSIVGGVHGRKINVPTLKDAEVTMDLVSRIYAS